MDLSARFAVTKNRLLILLGLFSDPRNMHSAGSNVSGGRRKRLWEIVSSSTCSQKCAAAHARAAP
jgi:hypothetical protein